jgi:hypothetical protein
LKSGDQRRLRLSRLAAIYVLLPGPPEAVIPHGVTLGWRACQPFSKVHWLSEREFNGAEVAPAYNGLRRQLAVSSFVRMTVRSPHDFRVIYIPAEQPN